MKILIVLCIIIYTAILSFVFGAFLYEVRGDFSRFYHNYLKWHKPKDAELLYDKNAKRESICKYCNKKNN